MCNLPCKRQRLLLENINNLIATLPSAEQEYKEYLKASAANISACHAGYFAQDNSDSDEAIANEVADILHNKKGLISLRNADGTYLYNRIAFDSPLEKENIMTDIDEVVVYGKIPKSSIAIPTIVGENYSPDFMYVVKHKDGTKELNIVVETKLVEKKSTLRSTEDAKIKCAEAFFKQLTIDGYTVSFHTQLSNKKVKQIIEDVISN